MEELLKVLSKILGSAENKEFSPWWLLGVLLIFSSITIVCLYFAYLNPGLEAFSEIAKISFVLFAIFCLLSLLSFWAFEKSKYEKEVKDKDETDIQIQGINLKSKLEKFSSLWQEARLLLILNEFDGSKKIPEIKKIYETVFGGTLDSSVFYWLKNLENPQYSTLRKKEKNPPFIEYERNTSVSLTDAGREYLQVGIK